MEKSQEDLPYFKIFPKYLASVAPGQTVEFDNITCYHSIKLSTVKLLQAYYNAHLNGVEPTQIFSITEKDGWLYETTRDGKPVVSYSMVCNVFVCNVWKAGGLFNDTDVNCGDSSVNDNYKLKMYQDPELRPDICKEMDPENPLCQITGR